MTIEKTVVPAVEYAGDDATLLFGIDYPTFEVETLKVYVELILDGTLTELTNDVDFTVADIGVNGIDARLTLIDAGQAWINTGLATPYQLHIDFDGDSFQPSSFRHLGPSSPISFERSLDRLAMSVKAISLTVSNLDGTQTDTNTEDIAAINAQLIVIDNEITAVEDRVTVVEDDIASTKKSLTDASTEILTTFDGAIDEHVVLEYMVLRNGAVQYGRELLTKQGVWAMGPLEKAGNVGVTFTVTTGGAVATVRTTTTATGQAASINYKVSKFKI